MVTGEFYDTHRMMEASFYKGVAYVNPDIETTAITTGCIPIPLGAYSPAVRICLSISSGTCVSL